MVAIVVAAGLIALIGRLTGGRVIGGLLDPIFGVREPQAFVALVYSTPTSDDPHDHASSLWRARPDGGGATRLGLGAAPVISPDGRWIAFVREYWWPKRLPDELRVARAAGGDSAVVHRAGWIATVVWSPDSRRLGAVTNTGLVALARNGSATRRLARSGSDPSFSPDGHSVAYVRESLRRAEAGIYVVPSGGGTPVRVAGYRSACPVWGPRGIAFCRLARRGRGDIWLMRGDGSQARPLTHTRAGIYPFAWSRDGTRLLAYNPAMHNGRLWAVDIAPNDVRPLTPWVGDLFPQGLSRDGKTVLAGIGCGASRSREGVLETIPFAGGEPTVIVRGPCRGSWNR